MHVCVCVMCLIFFKINISVFVFGLTEFCERLFCAYCTGWGRSKELPLKKLKEKGSLENSKLIVKVEIQVHEVVDEGGITGKEMVDVWGFRVLCSQVFIYLLHGCFFILFPDFNIYIFAHVDNNDRLFQIYIRHSSKLIIITDDEALDERKTYLALTKRRPSPS